MDRHDVALRCYLAELTGSHANPAFDSDPKEWLYDAIASTAYKAADAFMDYAESIDARPVKSGPSAPVAPKSEAAKYVPKVGDIVTISCKNRLAYHEWWEGVVGVVEKQDPWITLSAYRIRVKHAPNYPNYKGDASAAGAISLHPEYARLATDDEKRAAGIVSPSPEATRPTHIRWTGSSFPDVVRRVVKWVDGKPVVGLMPTRTNNEAPDEARLSDPIEGEWFAAPAPVEPAKGEALVERVAKVIETELDTVLDGNINDDTMAHHIDRAARAVVAALTPQVRA